MRISVGGQAQLVYLPLTLTERLGYFRDEGLDVTIQDFPGGAKALESLLGGSADVVCGFYDHTIQMAAEGKPMRAFVSMLRYPGLVLAVSPKASRRIQTIMDLKGATVGVSAPGSSTHLLLQHLLVKNGLAADAAPATGVGMTAGAVAAMEHGKVDAAVMADPAFSMLEQRAGGVRLLADLRTEAGVAAVYGVTEYPAAVLYAPAEWLEKNQILASRLAKAVQRTLIWLSTHKAEDVARTVPPAFVAGDEALYVKAVERSGPMYSIDGRFRQESATAVRDVMAAFYPKVRDARVNVESTFTNQFVPR